MMLAVPKALVESSLRERSTWERVVHLAAELVLQARELNARGWIRHTAVRSAIKRTLLGEDAGEEELERIIDDLLPLTGWAEWASDRALDFLPLERMLDTLLDLIIKAAYRGMKGAADAS